MQDIIGESLKRFKRKRARKARVLAILLVLSLVVSIDVFWNLRQPGWTLAGDADCGITEHTHDELCQNEETTCKLTEHIHTVDCYSDKTADVESQIDWQKMFEDYPFTGNLSKDLVGIAKTQVGYSESKLNFKVNQDGIRHGYTRYGEWYGTPYNDWSAIFVSFCLHYAGADQNEYPINTGANSMAEQWKALGRYKEADAYKPTSGDLVFFKNNTVGIISETFSTTIHIIRGDMEDSVQTNIIPITDESIAGWGIVNNYVFNKKLYDISNGPAFFIFAESNPQPQIRRFSLRNTPKDTKIENLVDYLNKDGSYFFSLMDLNNFEISKDANGNYNAHAGTTYKLAISWSSPNGFMPNITYQYQLPDGLTIKGGDGEEISDVFELGEGENKVVVGTWTVSTDGLITLTFNENMNDRSEVTISATMGVEFPEQEEPIDFDGKITVLVEKPREEIFETELKKWGVQGNAQNDPNTTTKTDPTKIYWTVQIEGNRDSNIPGSLITDELLHEEWHYEHHFNADDIANGLHFGVSVIDPEHNLEFWHKWTVKEGDPNLINWDADGWIYQMPEKITCEICHNEMMLDNDYHTYFIEYTSTPVEVDVAGKLDYYNHINVDNQTEHGWAGFIQDDIEAAIYKHGTLVTDADSAKIVWEVQATIPKKQDNQKAEHDWIITDSMHVIGSGGNQLYQIYTDMNLATITANYFGTTITVPHLKDATENDPYAYETWSGAFCILQRCTCTEEDCGEWNGSCSSWPYAGYDGWHTTSDYCDCWRETEDTTFTLIYETNITEEIKNYNGLGYSVRNNVVLKNSSNDSISAVSNVPIPSIVQKELEQDFGVVNGQIAKYNITVNESMLQLTDGSSLIIEDEMSKTLAFIRGSLKITTEDAAGNISTLQEGVDYTYTYNNDLEDTDHNNELHSHLLKIEIIHPQPVKYILDYDTTIVIPTGTTLDSSVKYKNSVSVNLWKKDITDTTEDKIYPDVNISSSNYGIKVIKKSANGTKYLPNAKFGIFNENGHLITEDYTDENGEIIFKTNIINGIVFREHVLYYIQELEAPPGYKLDDTKHWFCFCNTPDNSCTVFKDIVAETNAFRVPYKEIGEIPITNEIANYDLPSTGGIGIYPLILVSVMFIITPLVYTFIRRRKRERRGVG